MGNNQQGVHDLSKCAQYLGSRFEIHLLDTKPPSMILYSYITNKQLYFITNEGVECFDQATNKSHDYLLQQGHSIGICYYTPDVLFLAENTGVLLVLDPISLRLIKEIKPSRLLPGRITCMIEASGNLYLGHMSGDVTEWNIDNGNFVNEYTSNSTLPVTCLRFSHRYQLLLVSYSHNVEGNLRSFGTQRKYEKRFDGNIGQISGLLIFDQKNIVLGVDYVENKICLWDIITGSLMAMSLLPEFFPMSNVTCICSTSLGNLAFAIGFTNNSVAWGNIGYSQDDSQYYFSWKGRAKCATPGNVIAINYCDDTKGFFVSCDKSVVLALANLDQDVRIVQYKKPLFALSDSDENNDYTTKVKVYRRELTNQSIISNISAASNKPVSSNKPAAWNKHVIANESMVKKIRERIDGKAQEPSVQSKIEITLEENIANFMKNIEVTKEEKYNDIVNEEIIVNVEVDNFEIIKKYDEKKKIEEKIEEKKEIEIEQIIDETGEEHEEVKLEERNIDIIEKKTEEIIGANNEENNEKNTEEINEEEAEAIDIEIPLRDNKDQEWKREHNEEEEKYDQLNRITKEIDKPGNNFDSNIVNTMIVNVNDVENQQKLDEKKETELPPIEKVNPIIQKSDSNNEIINPSPIVSIESSIYPEEKKIGHKENSLNNVNTGIKNISSEPAPMNQNSNPAAPKPKKLSPFQIFLKIKRPELLLENPTATYKEIVLIVSQLWGNLSESEKSQYETNEN